MNTLELKLETFDKLKSVEEISLLKKIMILLKYNNENKTYILNEAELFMVKEG